MALGTGRHGNPPLIDRRIRIDLGLDSVNAMAGRAGGRVASPPCGKGSVDALNKLPRNVRVAHPARLRNIGTEDRGLGIDQGSQVMAPMTARAGHLSCHLMNASLKEFPRTRPCP